MLDDVELIVSELVSNAVRHGRPAIVLRLRSDPFAVDIGVLDHGPGCPEPRDPSDEEGSGRGLRIVEMLSSAWGVQQLDDQRGKLVWASVPCA